MARALPSRQTITFHFHLLAITEVIALNSSNADNVQTIGKEKRVVYISLGGTNDWIRPQRHEKNEHW